MHSVYFREHPNSGGIAQLVERLLCKQEVIGSNPLPPPCLFRMTIGPVAQLVRARLDKAGSQVRVLSGPPSGIHLSPIKHKCLPLQISIVL